MAQLRPTSGYVLIEPVEAARQTASGIVLPESAGEKPQKGKVIAVGGDELMPGGEKKTAPCQAGDVVYFKKWGTNDIKVDDKEFYVIKFDDVMAIEG